MNRTYLCSSRRQSVDFHEKLYQHNDVPRNAQDNTESVGLCRQSKVHQLGTKRIRIMDDQQASSNTTNGLLNYLDSPEFLQAAGGNATRLVAKLKAAVTDNQLYETHQVMRTIYFRFVNNKEKLVTLGNLLFLSSVHLLDCDELSSGQDIGCLYLETAVKCLRNLRDREGGQVSVNARNPSLEFHKTNHTYDWDVCHKLSLIVVRLPDTDIGKQRFVATTLKELTPDLVNRSLLHNTLAVELKRHKDPACARYHYLRCASPENATEIAHFLIEYQQKQESPRGNIGDSGNETPVPADSFIAQFLFHYLCLQSPIDQSNAQRQRPNSRPKKISPPVEPTSRSSIKSTALEIFSVYACEHPGLGKRYPLTGSESPPKDSLPLLNFIFFITILLDGQQEAGKFKTLCDIYDVVLQREPNYKNYLSRIGSLYFGIVEPSKQRQGGGFLNNILMSMLQDSSDEDENENEARGNVQNQPRQRQQTPLSQRDDELD